MPLNVRRYCTSLCLVLFGSFAALNAQTPQANTTPVPAQSAQPIENAPTAGDIMRGRISKAKAFIAVRNYNAAIYELEGIRRESNDTAVLSVVNVLLMNSFLEQGDHKRAQEHLNQAFAAQKTTKPNASAMYFAIAGQVVKGARTSIERYRALGLNVSDRSLPLEAINDLEKMRETLEVVVKQSKEISSDKTRATEAMALLEEASASRSMIARDGYDARRWKDEVADTRESIANSGSVVMSAVSDTAAPLETGKPAAVAANSAPVTDAAFKQPTAMTPVKPIETSTVSEQKTSAMPAAVKEEPKREAVQPPGGESPRIRVVGNNQAVTETPVKTQPEPAVMKSAASTSTGPYEVGSLIAYATKQSQPIYPVAARTMRTAGVVKVEVTVDENGNVAEVQNATGPAVLQSAAKEAIRRWRFKPFMRDGQAVKVIGFVNFNFAL